METGINNIIDNYVNEADAKKVVFERMEKSIGNTRESLLNFMSQYIEFNSVFAGCVSSLAGRFHLSHREHINKMRGNDVMLNKVSHLVAKHVFEAAIDEYKMNTHKSMSLFTWNQILKFYKLDSYDYEPSGLNTVIEQVSTGYGFNQIPEFGILSENLGFHIGSEKLASFEFDFLYTKIQKDFPELYSFLKDQKSDEGYDAMLWIKIHGSVEEDHCQEAITAANILYKELHDKHGKTVTISNGPVSDNKLNFFTSNIDKGFRDFHMIQDMFFDLFAE